VGVTGLADPKIQAYLATKDVVLLATVNPDGSPLAMPMWFLHDPTTITMLSIKTLAKVRNLENDPRVAVVAESGGRDDIRGVAVRGRAAFITEATERARLADRFLAKYDPQLARIWNGRQIPANRVLFRVEPTHVRSWGLGLAEQNP
jgi:PPOX class probable F420-dependent enzyme